MANSLRRPGQQARSLNLQRRLLLFSRPLAKFLNLERLPETVALAVSALEVSRPSAAGGHRSARLDVGFIAPLLESSATPGAGFDGSRRSPAASRTWSRNAAPLCPSRRSGRGVAASAPQGGPKRRWTPRGRARSPGAVPIEVAADRMQRRFAASEPDRPRGRTYGSPGPGMR